MKKEINSKSRRKWIMGGLAAFASVALLTTGFAVWVVGVNQTNNENGMNVQVDTAVNKSVIFDAKVDKSQKIVLAESSAVTKGFVRTEADLPTANFKVKFSTFEIKVGQDSANDYDQIKIELVTSGEDTNAANKGDSSNTYVSNAVTSENKKQQVTTLASSRGDAYFELNYTVIDLPTISGDTTQSNDKIQATKDNDNTIKYELADANKELDLFKWGDFFNRKSPCTFYNEVFKDENNKTAENAAAVQQELDAMHKQLDNKTIGIKMSLQKKGN